MSEQQELPTEVNRIHTACRGCIFASYDGAGKTQVGCKMNRIEPFRALGNLLEAEDGEKEFFIINGRFCNAFQKPDGTFAKAFKPEDWAQTMRKMLQLRLTVLVVLGDGTDLQVLEPTTESLKSQSLLPHQVIFINNQAVIKPPEFHAKLFKQLGNSVTWRINQICERAKDGSFVTPERAIDHAMGSVTGSFYTVLTPGATLPDTFVRDLDAALNDRMERFSLLLPDATGNCLTVQTDMHKHPQINGNVPMVYEVPDDGYLIEEPPQDPPTPATKMVCLNTVVEKLQHYATLDNRQYMVRSVLDICPNLQKTQKAQ